MDKIHYDDRTFVPFIEEQKIQERVKSLAEEIYNDYKDKEPVFIGILNGAFIFMSDLLKNYRGICEIDFMKLSSYGDKMISSGEVKLKKDLGAELDDRDVIIVEDIVDTGYSLAFLRELISRRNPTSVSVVSLLHKPDSLKKEVKIDYIGFEIPSKFVIGYGLDLVQKYRNLTSIYVLDSDK